MEEKSTGDLSQELMEQSDLDTYIRKNSRSFDERTFAALLASLYDKKDISRATLAR